MAKTRLKLAKPGKRFGAACIDLAIPFVLYIIIMIAASRRNTYSYYGYNSGYGYGYYEQSSGTGSAIAMAVAGLLMLAYIVVECVFFAKAMSIGKKLIGLQVVSSLDGTPLKFWRMLYRECIVKQASSVLMLGYIWILVDERHRAWHDKIMDTYVVDIKVSEPAGVQTAPAPAAAAVPPVNAAPAAPVAPAPAAPAPAATPAAPAPAAPAPAAAPAAPAPAASAAPAPAAPAPTAAPVAPAPSVAVDVELEPAAAPAIPAGPSIRLDVDEPAPAAVKADMSMKKEELLAAAAKLGVSVNAKMTKAEIIEAINKASK